MRLPWVMDRGSRGRIPRPEWAVLGLTLWLACCSGVPGRAAETGAAPPRPRKTAADITEEDRAWWSFQPVRRPVVAGVPPSSPPERSIDALVEAELEARGLAPNGEATRRELLRRVHFDLIGLPPTPEEVADFERDSRPDAWERRVDRLLSMPQYGERWARHWLDVVRFAQSNGYERDGEKPESWRYRDYVVKSFNDDKPYDRFVREQIAGDELPDGGLEGLVATGFQRLGVWDDEPDDARMAEYDELDDVLSTTGTAFLGLTIGCARCHEHKFDPIPQAEYYGLLAYFRNLRLSEAPKYTLDSANYAPLAERAKIEGWRVAQADKLKDLEARAKGATNDATRQSIARQIEGVKREKPPFEWALVVRERGTQPPPTHVLSRGNPANPGAEVVPSVPTVLCRTQPIVPPPVEGASTSGRRRVLADWIASGENPLTSRVFVNRVWQHHFGRGLVPTPSDFGRGGEPPTHPRLLDWLAAEFAGNGWSIKKLHRAILLSKTYRRSSSTASNPRAREIDPANRWLWRQNLRRLEAEALRDNVLAVAGTLNPRMGGRGFFPRLSGEVLAGQSRPGLDWELSPPDELVRRSLYAYVRRTMTVPMLDAFDYSNTTSPLPERPVTTVAPQSLMLLNDDFLRRQAGAMAKRLAREAGGPGGDDARFVERGFEVAIGRRPTASERRVAEDFLRRQRDGFAARRTRLTFRPDVPASISVQYFDMLQSEHFLVGPTSGWAYFRGRWSAPYEGIRTCDRDRIPFALASGLVPALTNGVLSARIELHTACEAAGLLFRASAEGQELRGLELAFEPREQRIVLRRHGTNVVNLAAVPRSVPTGEAIPVRIELADARVRVWLEEETPLFDVVDPREVGAGGNVGVRSWGAPVSIEKLEVARAGAAAVVIWDEEQAPPEERARQAFCLLLLNLNETHYVD